MSSKRIVFNLSGLSDRDKEQASHELARVIQESDPTAQVERQQEKAQAQDLGSTVVLVLGTGAALQVAQGIRNWMGRWRSAEITISGENRKISAKDLTSTDAVRLAELFGSNSPKT